MAPSFEAITSTDREQDVANNRFLCFINKFHKFKKILIVFQGARSLDNLFHNTSTSRCRKGSLLMFPNQYSTLLRYVVVLKRIVSLRRFS